MRDLTIDEKRGLIQTLTDDAPNEVVEIVWSMEGYKYEKEMNELLSK